MPNPMLSALNPRSMALRFGLNQLACALIAVILWRLHADSSLWHGLVFSLAIGNACWLLIDCGRALAAHWTWSRGRGVSADWPGWGWMLPIVVGGSLFGYLLGHAAARLLLGMPAAALPLDSPLLLVSVVAALTIAYVFYSRERLHQQQVQAAAAERLASQTQLRLLQSQLEPHMLFNTLANLRVLIGLDPPQAQRMLDQLVRFLRSTLASTRVERHSLAAEFDALRDYLSLMAVRMGPRLHSRFDLPEELASVTVPPLLLQPLVENAIQHGLEPQVAGGCVDVTARRAGQRLRLTVRDDGRGLVAAAASGGGSGFGTQQVRQRLAALYGDAATFDLHEHPDGGTEAVIELPLAAGAPP